MRKAKFLLSATLALGSSFVFTNIPSTSAADPAPYYQDLTQSCATTNYVVPCHNRDDDDAYFVLMAECSTQVTMFCYTATMADGTALPATVKIVAGVSAYKVHTSSVDIAGYESFMNAFYVPPTGGASISFDYFGSSDRPKDQSGNHGKLDLSPALSSTSEVKVVLKYKTTALPQYSVLVADSGTMDFELSGQDLSVTMRGKPARVAVETAAQHINFDTEKDDDATKPWTDRCGIPSMQFVVCNVDTAASDALAFYARTKTFVFGNAASVPGPNSVSTNATYFHFPSIKVDAAAKTKRLEVKTAAPHRLSNGSTLHVGNFTAFLPNGILTEWQVPKTDETLKRLLSVTIEKEGKDTALTPEFAISETGVKVVFPQISYSAPVMKVGTTAPSTGASGSSSTSSSSTTTVAVSPSTTAVVATPTTTTPPSTKTIGKSKRVALTSLIKLTGAGRATWRTTGGCRIVGTLFVASSRATTCVLTLRQAAVGSTKASTKTLRIKVA